jgi:hypothetical protein
MMAITTSSSTKVNAGDRDGCLDMVVGSLAKWIASAATKPATGVAAPASKNAAVFGAARRDDLDYTPSDAQAGQRNSAHGGGGKPYGGSCLARQLNRPIMSLRQGDALSRLAKLRRGSGPAPLDECHDRLVGNDKRPLLLANRLAGGNGRHELRSVVPIAACH